MSIRGPSTVGGDPATLLTRRCNAKGQGFVRQQGDATAHWEPWLGTNFYGVLNCARAAVPGMAERRRGRVITVISDGAARGASAIAR